MADWRFGAATCVGVHVIYTVNLYGGVLILAFISLDRYLAVVRATDTNTGGLRQLLAHRLVYAGERGTPTDMVLYIGLYILSWALWFVSGGRCLVARWPPGGT